LGRSSFALKATSGQQIVQGSLDSVAAIYQSWPVWGKNFATSWQRLAKLLQECSNGSADADASLINDAHEHRAEPA
jgi:hypothetical protein